MAQIPRKLVRSEPCGGDSVTLRLNQLSRQPPSPATGMAAGMIYAAIKAMRTKCERLEACILAMTFAR